MYKIYWVLNWFIFMAVLLTNISKGISGWVGRASATETVNSGSISGWGKPKTIINLVVTASQDQTLLVQHYKAQCETVSPHQSTVCGRQPVAVWLEGRKFLSLSAGQGNFGDKDAIKAIPFGALDSLVYKLMIYYTSATKLSLEHFIALTVYSEISRF